MTQTKKNSVPERRRSNAKLTIIAALLLAHWSSAGAADNIYKAQLALNDFTDLPLENLMNIEVQSASRFKQTVSEAPSAVSVITATDIRTFGWRSLADIVRSLPGVYTSNDRTYTTVAGRGMSRPGDYNMRYLLMIDGHRVNDPLYDQAMMGQEFMLDVDLIDRVEYVPGPGSAVYGTNAFFGVINVITKRGRDINGVQASVEGGSTGMHRERATIGGKGESGVEWLLSATNVNRDGKDLTFSAFPGQVARGLDYERVQSVFAKGSAGPFTLSLTHAERKKGTPTAEYGQNFNDPRSGFVDTMSYLNVGYSKALSDKTELSAHVFYNRTQYSGRYIYGTGGADEVDHDGSSASWWGGDAKMVSTAIHGHKLVTGVEFQKNQSVRQWNYNLTPAPDYSLNRRDSNYRIGLYLQDEWTLQPDLLLSTGLRYDYNSQTSDTNNINPRLGLIYKITPQTTAKLLFGKAFRLPNFYEMYYSDSESQLANAKLRPERITSVEAILEHQWASRSHARLSVFRNKVRNLITSVTYDPLTDPDPASNSTATPYADTTQFRNIGSATALGVEAELQKTWSDGSRLRTSLSWQKATDDNTGATLVNAPKWLGKANLSMPLYNNLWRAGAEVQYVATRNTESSRLGGYTLANLTLLSDRLIKGAEVSVSIYNLLNRKFSEPVGADFTQDAIPQDGRNFRVKLTYNF